MKKQILYLLALSVLLINGCQKELSFETSNSPSQGSLQTAVTGDCFPKTINGVYEAGKPLAATNTVSVSVNVTKTGAYTVYTDTVNGYYFRGTGIFTALGTSTITLSGNGTPFTAGSNNFVVHYDSTICDLQIVVSPAGAGAPAVYTLGGAGGSCTTPIINGTYAVATALNGTNTVVLNISVTTVGTYNISTATTNGMNFNGSGSFVTTGAQTVTLNGSGIPLTGGNTTIPVSIGTANCSFVIPVSSGAVGTLGGGPGACTPSIVNGTYTVGSALSAANTVQIQITVTTAGTYSITTNTVAGFSFSGTGTVAVGPNQQILLTATGTPTASGPQLFTVTFGTSTCTFTVNCVPAPVTDYFPRTNSSNWSYEDDNVATDSLLRRVIAPTLTALGNTYNVFMQNDGITPQPDSSGYYRKSGGDYYEYFNLQDIGFDNPQWIEYIMLKDNVAATTSWNSAALTGTVSATAITVRFKYTILQKDVPVSVTTSLGTVNYTNVIVVEEKFEQFVAGTWQDVTSVLGYGKSYYARNIGLIKYEYFDPGATIPSYLHELRRYVVF